MIGSLDDRIRSSKHELPRYPQVPEVCGVAVDSR
jgi:hypothetical protein